MLKYKNIRQKKVWKRLLAGVTGAALLSAGLLFQAPALAIEQTYTFEIPSQNLGASLREIGLTTSYQILFSIKVTDGLVSPGISGDYTVFDALDSLLEGTGLFYEITDKNVILIKDPALKGSSTNTTKPIRVAQSSDDPPDTNDDDDDDDQVTADTAADTAAGDVEEVYVIGTNIRGASPVGSPFFTYDRMDIEISGFSTVTDFIQSLSQNFGGGSNMAFAGLPNDDNSSFNSSKGSSVNLRGLGSGSTLVLLNGHRMAPSSGIGDFVDISMIPASAIERIEILTDGASSIYGADAVAGVINFVLRDDFDGIEASFRYGTAPDGDIGEYRASFTGGKKWGTGNALVVYEFYSLGNLSSDDRSFSQGAVLPNDILPSQKRHSILASASQELTPNLEIFADFIYTKRDVGQNNSNIAGDTFRSTSSSENLNISAGGSWQVSDTWFVDFSATNSDLRIDTNAVGAVTSSSRIDSTIWTADVKASGTVLNLPGGDLKIALGGHYRTEEFKNFNVINETTSRAADRKVYAVFGEVLIPIVGPDNAIPGIQRLEVNVSGRFDHYSDFGSTANPKVGVLLSPVKGLNLRGSFSTSFKPPPLGRIGSTDFSASAVPTSFLNTVFGLTPGDPSIADVVVLTAFGTEKDLDAENSKSFTAGLDFSQQWGRNYLTFSVTWFNIDFEDRLGSTPIPENRIIFDAPNVAFNNPELFPDGTIIFFPTQSEITNFLDSLDSIALFPGVDPLDAAIINLAAIIRNLSRTLVRGFDFNLKYIFKTDKGTFSLGLGGTYLMDFQKQAAVTTPLIEQINTLFNPVDLKLRGHAGYAHNGFAANLFINYTDGYHVDNTPSAARIKSWTTIDLTIRYDFGEQNGSFIKDMVLSLNIRNLFDQNPPPTPGLPAFGIFGYDPTNANPLGRFVSLNIAKKW